MIKEVFSKIRSSFSDAFLFNRNTYHIPCNFLQKFGMMDIVLAAESAVVALGVDYDALNMTQELKEEKYNLKRV